MRSSFAFLAAGSLAITALGRLVDFGSAPEANMAGGIDCRTLWWRQPRRNCLGPPVYQNYTPSGGYHAYALGTTSCNQGTPLLWQANTNLHPVIGQNMYRWKDGRFGVIHTASTHCPSQTADHAKGPMAPHSASIVLTLTASVTALKAASVPSIR